MKCTFWNYSKVLSSFPHNWTILSHPKYLSFLVVHFDLTNIFLNVSLRMRDFNSTFSSSIRKQVLGKFILYYFFKPFVFFQLALSDASVEHEKKALKRVNQVFRGKDTNIAVHDRNACMTPLLL